MAGNSVFTTSLSRSKRITIHWVLQAMAGVLIVISFCCMYLNKIDRLAQHFTTWHGVSGLTSVILTLLTIFGGVFTKYSVQFKDTITPITSKLIHSAFGLIAYILGAVTIVFGIYSDWFSFVSNASIQAIMLCIIIFTTIYTIFKSSVTFAGRLKSAMSKT